MRLCAFHSTDHDLAALLRSFLLSATAIGDKTTIVCQNTRSRTRIAGALASIDTDLADHPTVELLRSAAGARLAGQIASGLDAILQRPGRVIVYQPVPVGLPLAPASPRCSMILWLHDLAACTATQAMDAIGRHAEVTVHWEGHQVVLRGAVPPIPAGTDSLFAGAGAAAGAEAPDARMAIIPALGDGPDVAVAHPVSLQPGVDRLRLADERLRLMVDALPTMVAITHADGSNWFRNSRWREYTGLDLCNVDDATCASVFHPEEIDEFGAAWKDAVSRGEAFEREVRVRRHDGAYRLFLGHGVPLRQTDGEILGWYGTMTDIEDRRQLEIALGLEADRARRSADISQRFAEAGLDLATVLDSVVRYAVELIGDSGVMRLLSDDRSTFVPVAIDNRDPVRLAEIRASGLVSDVPADGPLRYPLREGRSVMIPVVDDAVLRLLQQELPGPIQDYPVSSLMFVPMRVNGDIVGSLSLSRDHPGNPYTEEEQMLAQELADRAALTIQNARLFDEVSAHREQLRRMGKRLVEAQEAERQHLAHELHDELGQALTGLALQISAVRGLLSARQRRADGILREAGELAASILNNLRRMIRTLRPPILDDLGLQPALRRLMRELSDHTHAKVSIDLDDRAERLGSEVETAVFRIAQEAIHNIRKHAQASEARLCMQLENGRLRLVVEDTGVGFELPESGPGRHRAWGGARRGGARLPDRGFGLPGMHERALGLGGELQIESGPGRGTRVSVDIPVERAP